MRLVLPNVLSFASNTLKLGEHLGPALEMDAEAAASISRMAFSRLKRAPLPSLPEGGFADNTEITKMLTPEGKHRFTTSRSMDTSNIGILERGEPGSVFPDRERMAELVDTYKDSMFTVLHETTIDEAVRGWDRAGHRGDPRSLPQPREGMTKVSGGTAWYAGDSTFITDNHVVRDIESGRVELMSLSGRTILTRLDAITESDDLASLLASPRDVVGIKPIPLAPFLETDVGDDVLLMGYASRFQNPFADRPVLVVSPGKSLGQLVDIATTGSSVNPHRAMVPIEMHAEPGHSGAVILTDKGLGVGILQHGDYGRFTTSWSAPSEDVFNLLKLTKMDDNYLLTADEAARQMNLSMQALEYRIAKGYIPAFSELHHHSWRYRIYTGTPRQS